MKGVDAMNQDQVKGKWNQLKGEIKKKWARMTDDDFLEAEGDIDKLSGKIQERTGDRKEDIRKWLNERSQLFLGCGRGFQRRWVTVAEAAPHYNLG
jgi:uncharacterized protein YjbJ (UPF0337 family)